MKILISGGNSKFANELIKIPTDNDLIALTKNSLDITDSSSVEQSIQHYSPDVFIHTAALSRPMNIHTTNPEKSIQLNIIGTSNCVLACMKYSIKFVYISTDFVYPGQSGNYEETDPVYPINKYAWSKLGGESACMLYDNSLILRMAMFERPFPHDKAFVDSYKSCIWNSDAAKITMKLIELRATGTYNIGGERKSIYDFVHSENFTILSESRKNAKEYIPNDISMNINKLKTIL